MSSSACIALPWTPPRAQVLRDSARMPLSGAAAKAMVILDESTLNVSVSLPTCSLFGPTSLGLEGLLAAPEQERDRGVSGA